MKSTLKFGAAVIVTALFVSPVLAAPAPKAASGSTIMKVQPAPSAAKVQSVNAGTIGKVDPPAGNGANYDHIVAPQTATATRGTLAPGRAGGSGAGYDHIIAPTTSTGALSNNSRVQRDPPGHKANPDKHKAHPDLGN